MGEWGLIVLIPNTCFSDGIRGNTQATAMPDELINAPVLHLVSHEYSTVSVKGFLLRLGVI